MRLAVLAVALSIGCGSSSSTSPKAPATSSCATGPAILHVASIPPRPGERLQYDQRATYAISSPENKTKGVTHFTTAETITSVDQELAEEREVKFLVGSYQPDESKPLIDIAGKTYRVRHQGDDNVYFEGDARAPEEVEGALEGWDRYDTGRPHWLLRVLTDVTFKQGEETHLDPYSVIGAGGKTADIHVTLKKLEGDRAFFDFDLREEAGGAPVRVRGTVVLDTTRARLVSMDEIAELDKSIPAIAASGFDMRIDIAERFDYGAAPAVATAVTPASCAPRTTLHMPWSPPRVGDTFSFEQKLVADWTIRNPKTKQSLRIRGGWETATDERVVAVEEGVLTGLDVDVRKTIVYPMTAGDGAPEPISRSGDKLEIRATHTTLTFTRGGVEVEPTKDITTQVLSRGDVPLRLWMPRLVTERTFEVGVESHYTHEFLQTINTTPADVRVTLVSIKDDIARFRLDIKTLFESGERPIVVILRGHMDFDTKRVRPLSVSLAGDFDTPDSVEKDGVYTVDYQFRYPK